MRFDLHPGAVQRVRRAHHLLRLRGCAFEGGQAGDVIHRPELLHGATEGLVRGLALKGVRRLAVAPEVDQRQRLDRRILHRVRTQFCGQLDRRVGDRNALLEVADAQVVPHQAEVELLQAHGVATRLDAFTQCLHMGRCLGRCHEPQLGFGGVEHQFLVAGFVRQRHRFCDVRGGLRTELRPVIGEPVGRDQRPRHAGPVVDLLRQRVRLLIRLECALASPGFVQGDDVVGAAEAEHVFELADPVARLTGALQQFLKVTDGLVAAEQLHQQLRSRVYHAVALVAGGEQVERLLEGIERVFHLAQAAQAEAAQIAHVRRRCEVVGRQHRLGGIEHLQRFLEGGGAACALGGEQQVAGGACAVRPGAGLEEVVRELGRLLVRGGAVELLHRVGDTQMQPLPPRTGEPLQQCLPDLLMDEGVARLTLPRDVANERRLLRIVERVEEPVAADLDERGEQVEVEVPPEDGGAGEYVAALLAHALKALADQEPHAAWDFVVIDLDVAPPEAVLVKELARLIEVAQQLFDEEGIAVGLGVDEFEQLLRGRPAAVPAEHLLDLVPRQRPQQQLLGEALAQEILQQQPEWRVRDDLVFAIGRDREDAHLRGVLAQVLDEPQRRLIGPLQVLEDEQHRLRPGGALEEVAETVQEVALLLFGGQRDRLSDIAEALPQLGQQLRQFRGAVAQRLAELAGRDDRHGALHHLDEGQIGLCALGVVTLSGEREQSEPPRLFGQLIGEAGLADAGLTADQHQRPAPVARLPDQRAQPLPLRLAADVGGAVARPGAAFARGLRLPRHLPEPPGLVEALQRRLTTVDEGDARARSEQRAGGVGDQDLTRFGMGFDARRRVDRRAEEVVILAYHVAGVQSDAQRDAASIACAMGELERLLNAGGAVDGAACRLERDHQAVARPLHLESSMFRDLVAGQRLHGTHQFARGGIPHAVRELRRPLHVSEEDRDSTFGQFLYHYSHRPVATIVHVMIRTKSESARSPLVRTYSREAGDCLKCASAHSGPARDDSPWSLRRHRCLTGGSAVHGSRFDRPAAAVLLIPLP